VRISVVDVELVCKVPHSMLVYPSFWLTCFSSFSFAAPWLHVTYAIIGAWGANAYLRMERGLVDDINAIRANKGMPPLVGTNAWVRYSSEE